MKNLLLRLVVLLGIFHLTTTAFASVATTTVSSFAKVLNPNHFWYTVTSSGFTGEVYYGRHSITEDSILIGNHYYNRILYSRDSLGNNWEPTKKYARELDGKLWLLDSLISHDEVLVMDMNLEPGDIFEIHNGEDTLYVISTKIINDFTGQLRKVLELSCQLDEAPYITWVEGIGPLEGVFEGALGYCYMDFGYNNLTCFYDNDILVWKNETISSCWEEPIPPVSYSDIHPNSTWYSTTWLEDFGGVACELGINTINVKSSTIIKQQWSQILGVTDNGDYWEESAIPFYRKDNKMYFYEEDQWKLLYDFSAKVGDTVTYYISSKAGYYQLYGIYPDTVYTGPYQLIVNEIDFVTSETGLPLKRFKTEQVPSGNFEGHFMGDIVEKVGSTQKLFGNYGVISLPECFNAPELRCFEEFPTLLYKFVQGACDTVSSIKNLYITGLSINPNPGIDQLVINKESHEGLHYQVHSVTGSLLLSGHISPTQQGLIDTATWYSGMYVVSIQDVAGRIFMAKWVKM
jgi:hypothetical protein